MGMSAMERLANIDTAKADEKVREKARAQFSPLPVSGIGAPAQSPAPPSDPVTTMLIQELAKKERPYGGRARENQRRGRGNELRAVLPERSGAGDSRMAFGAGRGGEIRDTREFSPAKLAGGMAVKGTDQAMGALTGAADLFIGKNITNAGVLFGQDWSNNPISALNRRMEQAGRTNQDYFQHNVEAGGKTAEVLDKYGTATAAALPQALMAMATAGGSSAANGLQTAANAAPGVMASMKTGTQAMLRDPQYWLSFFSTVSDGVDQARADGADDVHAALYAMTNSLFNAGVEVGGGIQTLPKELQAGKSAAMEWVKSMVDEGREEVVQGVLERGLQNLIYQKDNPAYSATDERAVLNPRTAAAEFAGGAVVGGVLGGGQIAAGRAVDALSRESRPVGAQEKTAPETEAAVKSVTRIQNPYHGEAPVQTQKSTPAVNVGAETLSRAQNRLDGMRNLESVLPGFKLKTQLTRAYDQIFHSEKMVPVTGATFGGKQYTVDINKTVPGKVISDPHLSAEKLSLLDNLTEVVRNGTYIGSGEYVQHSGKNRPGIRYDYFETPVSIDGTEYIAAFDVEVLPGANNYRTHRVVNVSLTQPGARDTGKAPAPSSSASGSWEKNPQSSSINSVPQPGEEVNAENGRVTQLLIDALAGKKRVEQGALTDAEFERAADNGLHIDAGGKVYRPLPTDHIDRRTVEGVGKKNVNAFQFDHPELQNYYKKAAESLLADADISTQFPMPRRTERTVNGKRTIQHAIDSVSLRSAMDMGLSRNQIMDAAQALIHDHGQENYAAAKRLEIVLDEMLTNGYTTVFGKSVEPNGAYVSAKSEIVGSAPAQHVSTIPDELDAVPGDTPGDAPAVNENGLNALSEREQINLSSGKKNKIISTFSDTVNFVRNALMNKQSVDRAFLGKIPDPVAQKVLTETGVDIAGYNAVLPGDAVRHMFKNHGDPIVEEERGQINLTPERAAEIPEILSSPDRVYLSDRKDVKGRPALFFEKTIGDRYITVQAVSDGTHSIQADTLYIRKRTPQDTVSNAGVATPPLNIDVRNVPPLESSHISIPASVENVKSDIILDLVSGRKRVENGRLVDAATENGSNDSLGGARAGFDPYSQLQNQTDRFRDDGANSARVVDVPLENFEGRNIPESAKTIMGAQAIDESDVRFIEQQIADGKLAFDTITDRQAVGRAQKTIREKTFDGALEQYRAVADNNIITKDNTTLGQQLLLQAMREGNTANVSELLTLYTRNSTTVAQAMQAQAIFRKLSPEGQLVSIQKAVDAFNAKHSTEIEVSPENLEAFLNAQDDAGRTTARDAIFKDVAQQVPGTFRAKYDCIRYLAMLGNPRTHIRNILGNTLFQAPVAVKNRVGGVAEAIASAISGGKYERTKSVTGVSPASQLAKECRGDWANAKDFLTRSNKYTSDSSASQIKAEQKAFKDQGLGKAINKASEVNGALLEAEDTAAKKWIYTQSLAGYLKANGVKSISEADPALLNRARNYAAQEALRNTFNDTNTLSAAVSKLNGLRNSDNAVVKAAGYGVEGVLPFKKTPANILMRSAEYSPVGVVLGAIDTIRGAKAGDAEAVTRGLDRIASGVTGAALMLAGAMAAGAGYITGGDDEDDKQQAFNELTGHQNYSLELKNGRSITLDWLAPEAIPFFMGVQLQKGMEQNGLSLEDLTTVLKGTADPMLEMSMLQGLNDVLDSAAYAKQRGGSVGGSIITSALTNYITQVFPTVLGQAERVFDETRQTTYTDKNSGVPLDWQYLFGKIGNKLPGIDYQQIPYIDAWGREEDQGNLALRTFNNVLNPAYVSDVKVRPIEQELQRLADETGDTSVFPQRADKSITYSVRRGDEKISIDKDLTANAYERYARALGKEKYALLETAVNAKWYKAMSDGEKADYIGDLYEYANAQAKQAVAPGAVFDGWIGSAETARQDIGVSAAEYIALRQKYGALMSGDAYENLKEAVKAGLAVEEYAGYRDSVAGLAADKDARGESINGSKKEKVINAIAALSLSAEEKDYLYLQNYNGKTARQDLLDTPWH